MVPTLNLTTKGFFCSRFDTLCNQNGPNLQSHYYWVFLQQILHTLRPKWSHFKILLVKDYFAADFTHFVTKMVPLHSVATEGVMHIWRKILWCVRWVLLQTFDNFEMARIGIFFINYHQSILGHCYF